MSWTFLNEDWSQGSISEYVGNLWISWQLFCRAILKGWLWRHCRYQDNPKGPQKGPPNFSFRPLSEKLSGWPTIFISVLESSQSSLAFMTVWYRRSHFKNFKKFCWITFFQKLLFELAHLMLHACKRSGWVTEQNFEIKTNISCKSYFRFSRFDAAFNFRCFARATYR